MLQQYYNTMSYSVKLRSETITNNTKLNDTKYGGWMAVNIGTDPVEVYGVTLNAGEGLSSESIIHLAPGDCWAEPIDIQFVVPGGNNKLRLLRTIATKIGR